MFSEYEPSHHEEPRSILIDNNTGWSPNTDPFFRDDEIPEINQVLTEFFSESHAPSYIINSTQDTDDDPQDGAIAGPSGLCRSQNKNRAHQSDCQVPVHTSDGYEEENIVSNVSTSIANFCFLYESLH